MIQTDLQQLVQTDESTKKCQEKCIFYVTEGLFFE